MPFLRLTPINPKHVPSTKDYWQAIERGTRNTAALIQKDFDATTRTWEHKPKFDITITQRDPSFEITAGTDDKIYLFVSEGTKPHVIAAKRSPYLIFQGGYRAKTRVGIIGSQEGGRDPNGEWYAKKQVKHPGFPGRQFIGKIKKRRQTTFRQQVNQEIAKVNRLQK